MVHKKIVIERVQISKKNYQLKNKSNWSNIIDIFKKINRLEEENSSLRDKMKYLETKLYDFSISSPAGHKANSPVNYFKIDKKLSQI